MSSPPTIQDAVEMLRCAALDFRRDAQHHLTCATEAKGRADGLLYAAERLESQANRYAADIKASAEVSARLAEAEAKPDVGPRMSSGNF